MLRRIRLGKLARAVGRVVDVVAVADRIAPGLIPGDWDELRRLAKSVGIKANQKRSVIEAELEQRGYTRD